MNRAGHIPTEPLPFPSQAILIRSIDGETVRCGVSEVLAALIESRELYTPSQIALCRRFFNRESLLASEISQSHSLGAAPSGHARRPGQVPTKAHNKYAFGFRDF